MPSPTIIDYEGEVNRQHKKRHASAYPIEPQNLKSRMRKITLFLVGAAGIEPATSSSSRKRSPTELHTLKEILHCGVFPVKKTIVAL